MVHRPAPDARRALTRTPAPGDREDLPVAPLPSAPRPSARAPGTGTLAPARIMPYFMAGNAVSPVRRLPGTGPSASRRSSMKSATLHRTPARPRPSYVAAPPLTHPHDAAEGADVLAEVAGSAGVLLWGALRDVMLWARTPAAARAALFGAGAAGVRRAEIARAAPEAELWGPLLTLAEMTGAPERADVARVVYACRAVVQWAEQRSAPGTRLAFAQAAALAHPESPRLALDTARTARDLARYAQAETWFRRAVKLARGSEWETYGWSYVGLGVQYVRTGNYPAAQALFSRGLRTSRKRRLRELEAVSLHHLFTVAAERHDYRTAYDHAMAAVAAYPAGHRRLPALANDIARLWVHHNRLERALPVFEALAPRIADVGERMIVTANLARAAAGLGDWTRYDSARLRTTRYLAAVPDDAHAGEAWVILATADAAIGAWLAVEESAGRALEISEQRGEAEIRLLAEEQLEAARRHCASLSDIWVEEPATLQRRAERLADALVDRLQTLEPACV